VSSQRIDSMDYNKNKSISFVLFVFIFYAGMSCSRLIQPLWFSQSGCLEIFAFSYSLMAFVGAFSFVFSVYIDRMGVKNSIKVGCLLYSMGMFLRVIPNSYMTAAVSSLLSGLGASTILICLRSWILCATSDVLQVKVISLKNLALGAGAASGIFIGGYIMSYGYVTGLIFASIMPILAMFFLVKINFSHITLTNDNPYKGISGIAKAFKQDRGLLIGLIIFSGVCGLYTSFILPFLPLILLDFDFSTSTIGNLLAVCSIVSCLIQLKFKKYIIKDRYNKIYFLSEFFLALITFLLVLELKSSFLMVAIVFRAFALSISTLTQELIELDLIKVTKSSLFFGVIQSSFLVGDMLGAGIAGYAYQMGKIKTIIIASAVLIMFNAIALPLFALLRRFQIRSKLPVEVAVTDVNSNLVS